MNKIFYDEITQVDYAIITPNGLPFGNSFRLAATVSGELNGEEQVVVDFSTFKKKAKAYIDDPDYGIDHKLWVSHGGHLGNNLATDYANILLPDRSVYNFTDEDIDFKCIDQYIDLVAKKVVKIKSNELSELLGYNVELSINPLKYQDHDEQSLYFRYVHGLPKSTSWGCQNNVHGHMSRVKLKLKDQELSKNILSDLITELTGKETSSDLPVIHLFGIDEFVGHGDYNLELRTKTLDRGESAYGLRSTNINLVSEWPEYTVYKVDSGHDYSMVKLKGVPYTTVETITNSIGNAIGRLLQKHGRYGYEYEVQVYEGLSKGAIMQGKT